LSSCCGFFAAVASRLPVKTIGQISFVAMAILDAWIIVDTRRALTVMSHLGRGWGIPRERLVPKKPAWIWFYRIDAAVVLIGFIYMFKSSPLFR
jgi:hypothetical protein